jgi:hypothetical protein
MSEKIYACLLRLYPAKFRRAHGEDALQLFRDRLRYETGFVARIRLWLDIVCDLALSVPGQYVGVEHGFAAATSARVAGAPFWFVIEQEFLRPLAILSGLAFTLVALSVTSGLLSETGTFRAGSFAYAESGLWSPNHLRSFSANELYGAASQGEQGVLYVRESVASMGELFPPPIDYLALTNVKRKMWRGANVQSVYVYAAAGNTGGEPQRAQFVYTSGPLSGGCVNAAPLEAEQQRVLDGVIANLKQHYFDSDVAQQVGDALVARQHCGDDIGASDGKAFAELLTRQMREVSNDKHLEVVYSGADAAVPAQQDFARTLAAFEEDNCSFKKVQILAHNIGYVQLDAFREPSACGKTAVATMASLNNADAVIFDLRSNRGGMAEMVSLISSYLFDHPEYMFDPRKVPTAQSWTASPVAGSKLANKPVFVLTSSNTISAAEQFTYNLKMLKRATIVGETTAGKAHAGVLHRIDERFAVAIPESRAVNPYSRADWEGVGIQPDIKVPAGDALQAALREARARVQKK